jgi:hypothetical protein
VDTYYVQCVDCKRHFEIKLNMEDLRRYRYGRGLAQDIFPYLTADERELIISSTCGECFGKMFSDNEDEE